MNSNLYYIALLLPEKINNEILLLQNECMQKFKIKKEQSSSAGVRRIKAVLQ